MKDVFLLIGSLLGISHFTLAALAYPVYIALINGVDTVAILIGRRLKPSV